MKWSKKLMRLVIGTKPEWKPKPKSSPLDTDPEFQQLRSMIENGAMKPFQNAGLTVDYLADGKRLKTKNPARLIRDHLRKVIKKVGPENYDLTCRETATKGIWGVFVTYKPSPAYPTSRFSRRKKAG